MKKKEKCERIKYESNTDWDGMPGYKNSNLIAAAPELLKALEVILERLISAEEDYAYFDTREDIENRPEIKKYKDLILRAKGVSGEKI